MCNSNQAKQRAVCLNHIKKINELGKERDKLKRVIAQLQELLERQCSSPSQNNLSAEAQPE